MARPLRVEFPGSFYHIINRGNAGEDVFKSLRDREKFLEYLEVASSRFSLRIHTYCLMTNHYHLLVETPGANLSQAVQWINVSYAVYFNIKRQRRGHLFQGRFKSLLVDADEYLKHLSRYIHLSPVRAKMVESASAYPWSSYPFFIGKLKMPEWLAGDWLLSQFGKNLREARKNYQAFVENVDPWALEDPGKSPVGGFIIGSQDFVNWVKERFLSSEQASKLPNPVSLSFARLSLNKVRTLRDICRLRKCSRLFLKLSNSMYMQSLQRFISRVKLDSVLKLGSISHRYW